MAEGGLSVRSHSFDALLAAHIEFQRQDAAIQSRDFFLERQERISLAAGQDQVCPRHRKCEGKLLPQSTARPGDDGDSSAQIEELLAGRFGHRSVPGVRTTFIRFGSRAYSRSN